MASTKPFPAHDFVTIRDTFNKWRAENAPHLSRDEAIRFALGEWLVQQGYLARESNAATPAVAAPGYKPARLA